jgi:hypothetical protein
MGEEQNLPFPLSFHRSLKVDSLGSENREEVRGAAVRNRWDSGVRKEDTCFAQRVDPSLDAFAIKEEIPFTSSPRQSCFALQAPRLTEEAGRCRIRLPGGLQGVGFPKGFCPLVYAPPRSGIPNPEV